MEIIKLLNEHKIDLHAQDNVIKINSYFFLVFFFLLSSSYV
jgi:hypothetical protein